MNFAKKVRRIISSITASALMLSAVSVMPVTEVSAASSCIIDTSVRHQVVKGFGGMNLPEWMGSDLSAAQRQKAFGNGNDELGMSIVRIFVNPDKNQWYKTLETAKHVYDNGGIVFATPWTPPADMCEKFTRTYTSWNGQTVVQEGQNRLRHDKYAEYAQHLNDFVHYMRDNGVELYSISIQNEPDYGEEWTWMTEEECVTFLADYADVIDCPVMSPETFQYNKNYYNAILNNEKANANVDIWGTHFYGTSRKNMDFPVLENDSRELFMTEVYVPNSSSDADTYPEALDVAENIHNGLVVGNMNAYIWWYIRRSYGPMKENGNISKRGYCMAQYSKYVRPGSVRIDVTEQPAENVYVSAYSTGKNEVAVVAINKGTEGYAQQFAFGADEFITNVDRYRTSASENLAETKNLETTDNSFWAQLPAQSVSTFVVSFSEKPVEPDENGYYFHDTFEGDLSDWTVRGSGEAILSGRTAYEGNESLLSKDRTAAWNGVAKPLDDAVFKPGEEYSFSANAAYLDGGLTDTFYLKLQYTDANGDTQYKQIASANAINGQWTQLANTSYKIPEDASNMLLYVETAESTNNFYVDDVIGAVDGTTIPGAGETPDITAGDVNSDGVINSFDAILARRGILAGNFSSTQMKIAADVNSDSIADSNDVVEIQQFIAGEISVFSVSEPALPEIPTEPEDSDTYMSKVNNMMVEYASSGITDEKSGVEYGTLIKYQYYSTTRERLTNVNVLLPPGYSENEKYPVLYALHGFWENEDALAKMGSVRTMLGNLISTGEAEKMIVVFPYIYTSKTQESCSGLDLANSLNYDNFINDLKADLMPYIESNFSVKTGRENTAITGFSMGGRESLFIGLTLSDKFGFVGAACPAPGLTPGADLSLHPGQLQESELKPAGVMPKLIMITGGGNDGVVGNNPSTYHNILKNNGINNIWHYISTGSHDASSVQPHFYNYLRAIFN